MARSRLPGRTLTLAVLGTALLAPPAAGAAETAPPRAIQITLPGTHGYGIEVSGNIEGAHSTVTLSTGRLFSSAKYSVRGTITHDRVDASFGKLGFVSLHLAHSRVQQVRLSKSCRLPGSPAVSEVRTGTFLGRVRFRGEHGFTSGSARRVHGAIGEPTAIVAATGPLRHVKLFCLGGTGSETAEAKSRGPAILSATSSDGAINFLALADTAGTPVAKRPTSTGYAPLSSGPTTFIAADSETRGAMQILRSVISSAPAASFGFDTAFSSATVNPPDPFSGSATFERGADGSVSWTGSLAVSFPGHPDVALAGPQFEATLGDEAKASGESCAEYPGNRPCSSAGA
jgi:hypothetical protein